MTDQFDGEKDPVVAEADRGQVADAVQGRKEAEEDIAAAEQAADEELVHLDQPELAKEDLAVDQTDEFRNPRN